MKTKKLLVIIFIILWAPLLYPGQKGKPEKADIKSLSQKYEDWLNVVSYIILPKEKEVFLKLSKDRDRDLFIENFWGRRDPTPGTPENEYKDEHMRRWRYVNEHYGRGTSRPGWMTDMGRIHIILGEPQHIERFEGTLGIVPCQAWTYYGDPKKDLPNLFVLLFYQRGGIGEFKLYSPVADGPDSLLQDKRNIDPFDYEGLYEKIKEMAPTLADAAISIVPGEFNPDYSPAARNSIILADIFESPKKDIDTSYATHFLNYKGLVSTEYMTNYVDSEADVSLIHDLQTGLDFLNFSLAPKSVSIDYFEPKEQYYCAFRLDVSLRVGENVIFQYNRVLPFYFSEQDKPRVMANGVTIEDSFPIAQGQFRLTVLLQNSIGKEFSILEKDVSIPGDTRATRLSGPYLGYKTESFQANVHVPYKIEDKKLLIDPKNVFSGADHLVFFFMVSNLGEDLWRDGEVRVRIKGMREKNPFEKTYSLKLANRAYQKILAFEEALTPKDFPPDYYDLRLALVDQAGRTLDERSANFIISSDSAVPHPIVNTKGFPLSGQFLYFYMLANQYDKLNQNDKADAFYRRAYALNPAYKDKIVDYANFLIKTNKFDEASGLIEGIKDVEKLKFDYYLIKGKALLAKGDYAAAINSLLEGNKIYNSDTRLLNALGFCFYRTGQKSRALEVLRISLRLNAAQPEIKKIVEEIEKK
jgi:GWxTD domain-containing protein